jgi:anti-sigma factor RsiW
MSMSEDVHKRAERLISSTKVEGISAADRDWLNSHLDGCARCRERAAALEQAVAALRSVSISPRPAVVEATRRRVRMRAAEMREQQVRLRALWVACAISWVSGVLSAPLIWWGLRWVGQHLALPSAVWVMAFVLWWTLPAAGAAAAFTWVRGRSSTEEDLRGFSP